MGDEEKVSLFIWKSQFFCLILLGFFVSLYFSDFFAKTYLLRSLALQAFSRTEKPIFEKDLNDPGSPKMA